jgi:hypothetical protein
MNAAEIKIALTSPLLFASAIKRAEEKVGYTHRDHRAPVEAELTALRARWESEAPAREIRALAEKRGYRNFDAQWKLRTKDGWRKVTVDQIAAALAE